MTQNKKVIIGLTGGIGSGKSTVTRYLIEHGYAVVDADLIARHIVDPGTPALNAIIKAFGSRYLNEAGDLNRKMLGALVFNDASALETLNKITHERIYQTIWMQIEALKDAHDIIFADIPLLIESGRTEKYHEIWLIYVPRHVQIERLMQRDLVTREFAESQLAAQMSLDEKRLHATRIFDNTGTLDHLYAQVDTALSDLRKTLTIN